MLIAPQAALSILASVSGADLVFRVEDYLSSESDGGGGGDEGDDTAGGADGGGGSINAAACLPPSVEVFEVGMVHREGSEQGAGNAGGGSSSISGVARDFVTANGITSFRCSKKSAVKRARLWRLPAYNANDFLCPLIATKESFYLLITRTRVGSPRRVMLTLVARRDRAALLQRFDVIWG